MEENFSNGVSLQVALGRLVSTRQAKPNLALIVLFIFLGLILLIPGIGLLSEKAYVVGSVCLILSLPFFCLASFQFSLGQDELRIYQNGFAYKRRGRVQKCLWPDIESLTFATGKSNTSKLPVSTAVRDSRGTLVAVRANSGELIQFNENLRCESELIDAIKAFRKTGRASAGLGTAKE